MPAAPVARPPSPDPPAAAARRSTGWLDVARILAIVAVVTIHATNPVSRGEVAPLHSATWWVSVVVNAAALWSVPVFVMVSGALLLDPARVGRTRDFYRRRLTRIGIPLLFWPLVYIVAMRRGYYHEEISLRDAARLLLSGDPYVQMYFLFLMAGLYLLTPALRRLVGVWSRRELAGAVAIALAVGTLNEMISIWTGVGGWNAADRFLPYVGYYLAGWWLATVRMPRHALRYSVLGIAGSVALIAATSGGLTYRYGWHSPGTFLFGYLSPAVIALSVSVFVLLRVLFERGVPWPDALRRISAGTFGVYPTHALVLFPLVDTFGLPATVGGYLTVMPLTVALVIAVSGAASMLLARIPVARRVL